MWLLRFQTKKIHHSSNFGSGNSGAWTGPMAWQHLPICCEVGLVEILVVCRCFPLLAPRPRASSCAWVLIKWGWLVMGLRNLGFLWIYKSRKVRVVSWNCVFDLAQVCWYVEIISDLKFIGFLLITNHFPRILGVLRIVSHHQCRDVSILSISSTQICSPQIFLFQNFQASPGSLLSLAIVWEHPHPETVEGAQKSSTALSNLCRCFFHHEIQCYCKKWHTLG